MANSIEVDVAIVGGGVTGLFLSQMLSEKGVRVALIEKSAKLATGPSTNNEGWLHSGAYHAAGILDRQLAVQVARRVRFGHDKVRQLCPEAVEDPSCRSFALVDEERLDEVKSRWEEAEVAFNETSRREFETVEPEVSIPRTTAIFEVTDLGINTRMLYRKLTTLSVEKHARIYLNATLVRLNNRLAELDIPGEQRIAIRYRSLICAAGFGIKEFFKSHFNVALSLRCFVSHLIDLPRVCTHAVFCLNKGEATIMHHRAWSIIGNNADQIQVPEPPPVVDARVVEDVRRAAQRLVANRAQGGQGRACIKVDMEPGEHTRSGLSALPQLNVSSGSPLDDHYWVLPGKMTEAPSIADFLSDHICRKLGQSADCPARSPHFRQHFLVSEDQVSLRPIDTYPIPKESRDTSGISSAQDRFDVFLSYNHSDRSEVVALAEQLRKRGVRVWLDKWELQPGTQWQEALERIIKVCPAAAVVIGKSGLAARGRNRCISGGELGANNLIYA